MVYNISGWLNHFHLIIKNLIMTAVCTSLHKPITICKHLGSYEAVSYDTPYIIADVVLSIAELPQLVNLLSDVAFNWYSIGTQLGLSPGQLMALARECQQVPKDCLSRMLTHWLEGTERPTVRSLAMALKSDSVCAVRHAGDLYKFFNLTNWIVIFIFT